MSSGDRHERLETLFEQALRRPPEDRERFLEDHAGSDPELLEELRSLLAQADADPGFLDRLAEGVVARGAADALERIRHRRLDRGLRDRYRLRDRIGRGGMATVYVAEDVRHQRSVALKVLEPAIAASMGAERFLTEIRTTANLQHPHILPLFDSGEVDGLLYYVMPYVEGETLRERLDREGQLPVDDAVGIAGELADALDHAHRQGVVHRDLKPDNVLLHEGKAYLTDFGIALAVERAESGGRLTETGLSIGTPHYMSPEQATGEDRVGPPSDLYSLGCLLYEMLLGEPPHTGPTAQAIFARILTEEVAPLSERRRAVPAHVDVAVRRALEKLPADRFRSAKAFAEALGDPGFPRGDPGEGRDVAGAGSGRTFPGSGRVWLGALGLTAVAVLGWWGFGSTGATGAPHSIAVQPFVELTGSGERAYFGEGIAEEITNALGKIPEIRVFGRYSASEVRELDVPEVARRLGVDAVLTGSYRLEGDSVRITPQLLDARGAVLWSDQYDRALVSGDSGTTVSVIAIQEEIARSVAQAFRVTLLDEGPRLVSADTDSPEAYELYVLGRHHWNQRTVVGFREAVAAFQGALDLDPDFALAYSGLADAYVLLFEYSQMAPREALPLAREAAERALALDSTLAEAHTSLAEVLAGERRWEESEARFLRALELNPGYLTAHQWYGWLLTHLARHDEAIEYLRGAKALDPLSLIARLDLAAAYYHARRFEEALDESEACFEAQICAGMGRVYSRSLVALGRAEEALTAEANRGGRTREEVLALAALGREEEARRGFERYVAELEATGGWTERPVIHLYLAEMHVALGEHEAALDAVERAEELGLATGPVLIREWPAFDPVRGHPRYLAVLERMGYPD